MSYVLFTLAGVVMGFNIGFRACARCIARSILDGSFKEMLREIREENKR